MADIEKAADNHSDDDERHSTLRSSVLQEHKPASAREHLVAQKDYLINEAKVLRVV